MKPENVHPDDVTAFRDAVAAATGQKPSEEDVRAGLAAIIPQNQSRHLLGLAYVAKFDAGNDHMARVFAGLAGVAAANPEASTLLTCTLCGAPRNDDISVRWQDGKPYCSPTCPHHRQGEG